MEQLFFGKRRRFPGGHADRAQEVWTALPRTPCQQSTPVPKRGKAKAVGSTPPARSTHPSVSLSARSAEPLLKPVPFHSLRAEKKSPWEQTPVHNSLFSTSELLHAALIFLGFPHLGLFRREDCYSWGFCSSQQPLETLLIEPVLKQREKRQDRRQRSLPLASHPSSAVSTQQ